jgi:hypothetical protein
METASFIDYSRFDIELDNLTHLYVGDEFCERLLPSYLLLEELFSRFNRSQKKISIVTPYLTNKGIKQLLSIIDWVYTKNFRCEIIINDWAVLEILRNYKDRFELIAGRLLISRYFSKFHLHCRSRKFSKTKKKRNFYCFFPESFLDFLKKNNIFRLEFNSLDHLKATNNQLFKRGFKSHIYFPFMYLTTSRYCTYPGGHGTRVNKSIVSCNNECKSLYAVMKNNKFLSEIFVKGNTYFTKITEKKDRVSAASDRIIYNSFI